MTKVKIRKSISLYQHEWDYLVGEAEKENVPISYLLRKKCGLLKLREGRKNGTKR